MKNTEYEDYDHLFPHLSESLSFGLNCDLCNKSGYDFISDKIIWGNGNKNTHLMIIGKDSAGSAPDERLWKASRLTMMPLTNKKSGAKIRILLLKAGIDPFSVFFTNVIKCNEGQDKLNLSFSKLKQVCVYYLKKEIEYIRPKVIITLGGAKFVNRMAIKLQLLAPCGFEKSEFMSGQAPFLGEFASNVRAEIFNLKHPSFVEGKTREANYIKNLQIISNHL